MISFAHYTGVSDISGVTVWLERLIGFLRAKDLPVSVFLRHCDSPPGNTPLLESLRAAGARVECLPFPRFTGTAVAQVLRFLERHRPRVFLPQCLAEHFYAARIAGKAGLPWVFTHHSDDPFYWSALRVSEPHRSTGRVVAVSPLIARRCSELPGGEAEAVIPCGVPASPAAALFRRTPFRVVYSGRMVEQQKRVSLVLQTFLELCRRSPSVECRFLGDGPELEACRRIVSTAGFSERILFAGRLAQAQVRAELAGAQAILFMSDYEGLPVALLEAMAAGVVPVCRRIESGIPDVVRPRETGLLTGDDPREACAAVLELADNESLWQTCSTNAARLVRTDYGAAACQERWLDFLKPSLSAPSPFPRLPGPGKLPLPPYDPSLELNYMRLATAPARYAREAGRRIARLLPWRNSSRPRTPPSQ